MQDTSQDYALAAVWALILGAGILLWPVRERDRKALMLVWAVKVFVTLVVMFVVQQRYGPCDPDAFFAAATEPGFVWDRFRLGQGNENIARLTWLHLRLVPGSFHAVMIGFSMAGLIGVYLFHRAGILFSGCDDPRVFYALALFPSILFWSSILGKDPISLFSVAVWVHGVAAFHRLRKSLYLLNVCAGILLASLVRPWMGPIMILPTAIIMVKAVAGRALRWALVLGLAGFGALCVRALGRNLSELLAIRAETIATFMGGGSSMAVPEIGSLKDVLRCLPAAVFTALFRPLPGEVRGVFGLFAGLENAGLLLLLIIAFGRSRWPEFREPLVLAGALFLLLWGVTYGFTVYNFGCLARYKLQVLPLLLGLLLYHCRSRKETG